MQQATRQRVTFRNCTFSENKFVQAVDESIDYGLMIVSLGDSDVIVENCLFVNNNFTSNNPRVSYIRVFVVFLINNNAAKNCISMKCFFQIMTAAVTVGTGSTVVMEDNCFLNNSFSGTGTVMVDDADVLKESSGNFGAVESTLKCPYVYNIDTKGCMKSFESTTCKARNVSQPSTNETDSPSVASGQRARYHFFPVIIAMLSILLFGC
jgi:hypothetical protein